MKILVCGGRDYKDFYRVNLELLKYPEDTVIVHGGATGADAFAHNFAAQYGRIEEVYRADWNAHGRAAGPIRNQQMLDEAKPDLVMAFAGGRGTADMVRRAEKAGVRVLKVT